MIIKPKILKFKKFNSLYLTLILTHLIIKLFLNFFLFKLI